MIEAIIKEIDDGLASDRWAIVASNESRRPDLLAAAGLRHCQVLASEILDAARRDAEATIRILGRAFVETWIVTLYLHHGGSEALEALNLAYQAGIRKMQASADEHDEQLRLKIRKLKKRNRRIAAKNEEIRARNERNPDGPLVPLIPLLVLPVAEPIELDLSRAIALFDSPTTTVVSVYEMIQRIEKLTANQGAEESYQALYVYAYRTLSWVGAHPTVQVLGSYVDTRGGQANLLRVGPRSLLKSLKDMVLHTVLLLLSQATTVMFERRDVPKPEAESVLRRHGIGRGAAGRSPAPGFE